jgi:hypothetical protein
MSSNLRDPAFEAALQQASEEHKLAEWYRDCVRPLCNMPRTQWPRCCGRGCEPCADQLVAVAERIDELLGRSCSGGRLD